MALVNDRTPHLDLPLPAAVNDLPDDVERLRQSLTALDTKAAADDDLHQLFSDELDAKGVTLTAHGETLASHGTAITANSDAITDVDTRLGTLKETVDNAPNLQTQIHGATAKTVLVDADELVGANSASAWSLFKVTMASIKTYIQAAALTINGALTSVGVFKQGALDANGQFWLQGASMEIGQGRTGDGVSYVDFHSAVGTDYEARITRNSGANGQWSFLNTGTGGYNFAGPGAFTYNGAAILVSNLDATLGAGYRSTYVNDGAKSGGAAYMPTYVGGNFRLVQNAGAFVLTADSDVSTGAYTLILVVQNTATAGAITFASWSAITGDAFTTVNGALFLVTIVKHGGVKTVNVQAL